MEFDSEARATDESDQFCVLCPLVEILGLVVEIATVAHFDDVDRACGGLRRCTAGLHRPLALECQPLRDPR